MQVYTHYFWLY